MMHGVQSHCNKKQNDNLKEEGTEFPIPLCHPRISSHKDKPNTFSLHYTLNYGV